MSEPVLLTMSQLGDSTSTACQDAASVPASRRPALSSVCSARVVSARAARTSFLTISTDFAAVSCSSLLVTSRTPPVANSAMLRPATLYVVTAQPISPLSTVVKMVLTFALRSAHRRWPWRAVDAWVGLPHGSVIRVRRQTQVSSVQVQRPDRPSRRSATAAMR